MPPLLGVVGTHRGADLDMEAAHGGPVIHGVEGGHLVDAHGGHLQDARHLVHDADAGEAVLALAEVENGHHGGLLVLGRVAGENGLDELLILRRELERYRRIVLGCVAVLQKREPPFPLLIQSPLM